MKDYNKLTATLYYLASILFSISGLISGNYLFITLGCCFVVFGSKYSNKKDEDKPDE